MSGHGRTICTCGNVVRQCRCPGPHTNTVVNGCQKCGLNGRSDGGAEMAAAPLAHDPLRRSRLELQTPAEAAIRHAIDTVEAAGCDPLLTDAVNLLTAAREKVADFVDGKAGAL